MNCVTLRHRPESRSQLRAEQSKLPVTMRSPWGPSPSSGSSGFSSFDGPFPLLSSVGASRSKGISRTGKTPLKWPYTRYRWWVAFISDNNSKPTNKNLSIIFMIVKLLLCTEHRAEEIQLSRLRTMYIQYSKVYNILRIQRSPGIGTYITLTPSISDIEART